MWLLSYEARNTSGVTRNLVNACGHSRVVASAFFQATASRNSTNSAGTMAIQYRPCRRARRASVTRPGAAKCATDAPPAGGEGDSREKRPFGRGHLGAEGRPPKKRAGLPGGAR